ncbi:MAG: HIRAN domain-containing protein [Cyclobacteriaceae bacterium]
MKRSEFIKSLGVGATGLLLPAALATARPLKIYDNYLRGLPHYQYKKTEAAIKVGDVVALERDYKNLHDSFAIAVFHDGHKLGYLAAYENIVLANMLDAGANLTAFVSQHHPKAPIYDTLAVEIFTDLITPTQPAISPNQLPQRADDAADLYRRYHTEQGYNYTLE